MKIKYITTEEIPLTQISMEEDLKGLKFAETRISKSAIVEIKDQNNESK